MSPLTEIRNDKQPKTIRSSEYFCIYLPSQKRHQVNVVWFISIFIRNLSDFSPFMLSGEEALMLSKRRTINANEIERDTHKNERNSRVNQVEHLKYDKEIQIRWASRDSRAIAQIEINLRLTKNLLVHINVGFRFLSVFVVGGSKCVEHRFHWNKHKVFVTIARQTWILLSSDKRGGRKAQKVA